MAASEILPGFVFIGGAIEHAFDENVMKSMQISHVLNCAAELSQTQYTVDNIIIHRLHLRDNVIDTETEAMLREGADLIRVWARTKPQPRILVHCLAGVSRSVSVVVAYLVLHVGMSTARALDLIREGRAVAHPYEGFLDIIRTRFDGTTTSAAAVAAATDTSAAAATAATETSAAAAESAV